MSFTLVVCSFRLTYACTFYACCFFSKHVYPLPTTRNSNEISISRQNRIMNLFSNTIFKVYCQFRNSALASLINLNHWCQRHDPIIYVIPDSFLETLCMLLSRFIQPMLVRELIVAKLTTFDVEISEKYLPNDNMFLSIVRNFLELLFDDGDINQDQHSKCRFVCWSLHKTNFVFAWKRFPLDNVLKRYRILNFHN